MSQKIWEAIKTKIKWSGLLKIVVPVSGIFLGIIFGSLVVVSKDRSLFSIISLLFYGAFGTLDNFSESLIYTIPLGFTGLAIVFSYRAGIFNIGCEGQLQLAAVATIVVATSISFTNPFIHILMAISAGAAVGSIWALIPGILKAYKGFNEIVVTMLMNYIAILMVSFFVQGPLKDPAGYFPQSRPVAATAKLQNILQGTHLHSGLFIFLLMAAVVWFVLFKTNFGFRIRGVGLNPEGSKYAGTNVPLIMVLAMLVSGALAGMAGSVEILGVHNRLLEGFSPGYGYDAIAVALLANLNPFGVIFSAFFFGALRNAAGNLQIDLGVPVAFIYIIQSLTILFVIGSQGMPRFIRNLKRRIKNA